MLIVFDSFSTVLRFWKQKKQKSRVMAANHAHTFIANIRYIIEWRILYKERAGRTCPAL
jgi:hypothetical protein